MKLNRKILVVNLLLALIVGQTAMADDDWGVDRTPPKNPQSDNSGPDGTTAGDAKPGETMDGDREPMCSANTSKATFFPQSLIRQLSRNDKPITVEVSSDKRIKVTIPPSINVPECGQLIPRLMPNAKTKDYAVVVGVKKKDRSWSTLGQYQSCLSNLKREAVPAKDGKPAVEATNRENIMVTKNGKKTLVHANVKPEEYMGSTTVFQPSMKDIQKDETVTVSYGTPTSFDDGFKYEKEQTGISFAKNCLISTYIKTDAKGADGKPIAENKIYLNKGRGAMLDELNAACKSGDAQRIADARAALGNYGALNDIMDQIKSKLDEKYLEAVKDRVDAIYAEMEKIENKAKGKDITEKKAKDLANEYAKLSKEISTTFLDPAIYRVKTLMAEREKLDEDKDEKRIAEIDEEIIKINTEINKFYKRKKLPGVLALNNLMEKYALNSQAKSIEDVRMKSFFFSRVYPGRKVSGLDSPITFEAAERQHKTGLVNFEKRLEDWSDQYAASSGSTYPIRKTERERENAINVMNKRWDNYQKKEAKDYKDYCSVGWTGSVKNPVRCKEFVNGASKRQESELRKRERDLNFIKGRNEKLDKMAVGYNEYQRVEAEREEAENSEYEGSSISGYEDSYEDRYYTGPSKSTAYDPSAYNLMGGSSSGQQQNPYANMIGNANGQYVNQQYGMGGMGYGNQQYQYQMQGGQWPGI